MSAKAGYSEARRLLEKKFGNKHRIAQAYLKKLREFPDVKGSDSSALYQFLLVLIECKNTMTGSDYLQELDNTASMKTLVDKLPFRLKYRWRINGDYLEEEHGKVVKYSDFVSIL